MSKDTFMQATLELQEAVMRFRETLARLEGALDVINAQYENRESDMEKVVRLQEEFGLDWFNHYD